MTDLFDKIILETIGNKILQRQETIAVAESVTAGLLQFALSNIPDAAKFLQGGLTAYNLGQKYKHLQVEPLHAAAANCVSQKVAVEMATQVCTLFTSDWGIGITGYASPVPQSGQALFVYYAVAHRGKVRAKGKIRAAPQDPPAAQLFYVNRILQTLVKLLKDKNA
ncbi:MAG: CinA family protein [Agriterribacter sp.]